MSLSDYLSIIIVFSAVFLVIIYIILKTHFRKKREKMPSLDDYIIEGFEKEYNRLKEPID